MFQIIMTVTLLPCVLIVYVIMKDLAKPKGYVVLGATVSASILYSSKLAKITEEYKKKLKKGMLILTLLYLPVCLIPSFSICFTLMMIWVLATIILPMIYFANGNKRIQNLKKETKICLESQKIPDADFLTLSETVPGPPLRHLLFPILLCAIPSIYEILHFDRLESPPILFLCFAMLFSCLIFLWLAYHINRMNSQIICTIPTVNYDFNREKKRIWGTFLRLTSWLCAVFVLTFWILIKTTSSGKILFVPIAVYGLLLILTVYFIWKKYRQIHDIYYEKASDHPVPSAVDDKGWIWGIFYYNPEDPHIMVEERAGMGSTVNMARPAGKVLAVILALVLLAIPLSCIMVSLDEFTPMRLYIEDNALIARQWRQDYKIRLDEIQNVDLIHELNIQSRLNGSAVAHKDKGVFQTEEYGRCRLFLINTNKNFLVLTAAEDIYIFCDQEEETTLQLYHTLQQSLNTAG